MNFYDYSDLIAFAHDADLIRLLSLDKSCPELRDRYLRDDFLVTDPTMRIPFFAETRDYVGAREKDDLNSQWIVKPVSGKDVLQTAMAQVVYFVDFMTKTLSAPIVLTIIAGRLHKATKLIGRAEQLSGANYTEQVQLKEQLLLDLINRWIYSDEDRNPNNYLIKYNSRDDQLVIAIDFANVDLTYSGVKIDGLAERFGWARIEKTQYLTPLKAENFLTYDMTFFNQRFSRFDALDENEVQKTAELSFRHVEGAAKLARLVVDNIWFRRDHVRRYFESRFPLHATQDRSEKYSSMGKAFNKIYDKFT